ncbi:MAG TPA: hypothetical protein VG960_01245 [Caulobacteraceae bacterium]|nr:hypothetical protein [Caulobacteraceae bacterium]
MSRLLICGFGPFPKAPDNPSALAVERLNREGWAPPGAQVSYAVLPTTWGEAAETALAALQAHGADAVLVVGVAVGAATFRLETVARNRTSQTLADAAGERWDHPLIDPAGPDERAVTAPVAAMERALRDEGLAVTLSRDAGDYLCNFTLYRLLAKHPPTAFLHVPAVGPDNSLDDIVRAVRTAATAFVGNLG